MVWAIPADGDDRRVRLVACAIARRASVRLPPEFLAALDTAEAFADHRVNKQQAKAVLRVVAERVEEERRRIALDQGAIPDWVSDADSADWWASTAANDLPVERSARVIRAVLDTRRATVPWHLIQPVAEAASRLAGDSFGYGRPGDQPALCHLLRDIFGNPFRPVAFDPEWRTSTAVALARGMYEARDFAPMPVLADALQDAGCEGPDILAHCRGPGPHARGCWVVDLVLGRS
jgi:hypothetical protein